jgi:hypothetical protein
MAAAVHDNTHDEMTQAVDPFGGGAAEHHPGRHPGRARAATAVQI